MFFCYWLCFVTWHQRSYVILSNKQRSATTCTGNCYWWRHPSPPPPSASGIKLLVQVDMLLVTATFNGNCVNDNNSYKLFRKYPVFWDLQLEISSIWSFSLSHDLWTWMIFEGRRTFKMYLVNDALCDKSLYEMHRVNLQHSTLDGIGQLNKSSGVLLKAIYIQLYSIKKAYNTLMLSWLVSSNESKPKPENLTKKC